MTSLFFSYSHVDEGLRDQLEVHLAMLKRQGIIETWHDRGITAGEELDGAIGQHVDNDDVILLLVSPDFLASRYCYDVEMVRAMARHAAGEAVVIPVILRPCDWHDAPFGKLMATPRDGRPVTLSPDRDVAFLEVIATIREAVARLARTKEDPDSRTTPDSPPSGIDPAPPVRTPSKVETPRSSNLAVRKVFTDRDCDEFRDQAFEYMAKFFANSVAELGARNRGVEGSFRRVDANRFFVTAYRDGSANAHPIERRGAPYIQCTHQRCGRQALGHTGDDADHLQGLRQRQDPRRYA